MVHSFSSSALDSDPEGAMAWAATIGESVQRTDQIANLSRSWLRADPTAARKWIAGTGQLTPERKAELLQKDPP